MAPPHTSPKHPSRKRSSSSQTRKAIRPSRLNKIPLSGTRIANSRALTLQSTTQSSIDKKGSRRNKISYTTATDAEGDGGKIFEGLGDLAESLPTPPPRNFTMSIGAKNGKSLKSQRGAQRKRMVLEKWECERFAKNMAVLAGIRIAAIDKESEVEGGNENGKDEVDAGVREKWAALKAFVEGSLN